MNFPPYNYGLSGTSYFGSNSQQGYTSYQECALVLVLLPLWTVALCSKSQGRHFCVEEPTFFISVLTWFILHSFTIVLHDFFNTVLKRGTWELQPESRFELHRAAAATSCKS